MEHPGPHADKILWLDDRHRMTCNKARTLFQQGWPWGEALIRTIETHCSLDWKITGVGVSKGLPTIVRPESERDEDAPYPKKRKTILKQKIWGNS